METKKCWCCEKEKPLEDFAPWGPNGLRRGRCLACGGTPYPPSCKRHNVRVAIVRAKKEGVLINPEKCSICGTTEKKIIAHHPSYDDDKVLDVVWCCYKCHTGLHLQTKEFIKMVWAKVFLPRFLRVT